jgi:hypothetical protein
MKSQMLCDQFQSEAEALEQLIESDRHIIANLTRQNATLKHDLESATRPSEDVPKLVGWTERCYYHCPEDKCESVFSGKYGPCNLSTHMRHTHGKGDRFYACRRGCNSILFKSVADRTLHYKKVHASFRTT